VASNCAVVTRPGVNVESSTRVVVDNAWATSYSVPGGPSGIRIADTPPQGGIRLRHVVAGHSDVGVLLENNGILSVRVNAGDMNFNRRGILLQGTSRATIAHNELVDNSISGIEIDAGSSGNVIVGNDVSGSPNDVIDNGAANCWRNNTFTTGSVPTCP
jgi:parallel beta-helix repeat protein